MMVTAPFAAWPADIPSASCNGADLRVVGQFDLPQFTARWHQDGRAGILPVWHRSAPNARVILTSLLNSWLIWRLGTRKIAPCQKIRTKIRLRSNWVAWGVLREVRREPKSCRRSAAAKLPGRPHKRGTARGISGARCIHAGFSAAPCAWAACHDAPRTTRSLRHRLFALDAS